MPAPSAPPQGMQGGGNVDPISGPNISAYDAPIAAYDSPPSSPYVGVPPDPPNSLGAKLNRQGTGISLGIPSYMGGGGRRGRDGGGGGGGGAGIGAFGNLYPGYKMPKLFQSGGDVGDDQVYGSTATRWDLGGQPVYTPPQQDLRSRHLPSPDYFIGGGFTTGYQQGGDVRDPIVTDMRTGERQVQRPVRIDMRSGIDPDWYERWRPRTDQEIVAKYGSREPRGYQDGGDVQNRRFPDFDAPYGYVQDITDQAPVGMPTGYAEPQPERPRTGHSLPEIIDLIHRQFGIGEARADEAPPTPQPRVTGYSGGYGGELTEPPRLDTPPRNALEEDQQKRAADAAKPPLSLQSPANPVFSGQATPQTMGPPSGSRMEEELQRQKEQQAAEDPNSWNPLTAARDWYQRARVGAAERELFEGKAGQIGGWSIPGLQSMSDRTKEMLQGDRVNTPEQARKVLDTIANNPRVDHSKMVLDTYNSLNTPEEKAQFMQSIRPYYNQLMGIAQAAYSQAKDPSTSGFNEIGNHFTQMANHLMPNERNMTIQPGGKDGGWLVTVRPEGPNGGDAKSYRLSAAQLHDMVSGPTMQFDLMAKNGLQKNLDTLTGIHQQAAVATDTRTPFAQQAVTAPAVAPTAIPAAGATTGVGTAATEPRLIQHSDPRGIYHPTSMQQAQSDIAVQRAATAANQQAANRIAERAASPAADMIDIRTGRPVGRSAEEQMPTTINPRTGAVDVTRPPPSLGGIPVSAQDPASIAARERFVRGAQAPPSQTEAIRTPEQAARATTAEGNYKLERARLIDQYRGLSPAARQAYGPAPWERPGWHLDENRPLPPSVYAQGPIQQEKPTTWFQQGTNAPRTNIPDDAIRDLINKPDTAKKFDEIFGQGAARRILGDQARY